MPEDIYKQALGLAKVYCRKWVDEEVPDGYFNPDDAGLVVLKLFSRLSGHLITQLNRIPDKHRLAFLDFVGIDLLPARPAMVPLTFYLSKGASGAFVPPGTMVTSSEGPEVVFETSEGLHVGDVGLTSLFSVNPWEDKYTDHSDVISGREEGFLVFGRDKAEKDIAHILYIGDELLFDLRGPVERLEISLEGRNLYHRYFSQWQDGNGNPLDPEVREEEGALMATFKDISALQQTTINNVEGFRLSVSPKAETLITKDTLQQLPMISRITSNVTVAGILPDAAFFNSAPVDTKKGFYPFGEMPESWDELYIGSEGCFSKEGAEITLDLEFEIQLEGIKVTLSREYWNGKNWSVIEAVADDTNGFTENGQTRFVCPVVVPTEINDQLNRWIRVRIVSGGYERVAVSKSGAIKIDEWFVRAFTGLFRSGFALKGLYISAQGQRSATLG